MPDKPISKEYYVCYFDVLGQRNAMKGIYDNAALISPDVQWEIDKTSGTLWMMYEDLHDLICEMLREPSELYDNLKHEQRSEISQLSCEEFVEKIRNIDYGVIQFSDSTLFYVESDNIISSTLLFYFLMAVSKQMPLLHSQGICMRGAVGIGVGWKVDGGNICGPIVEEVGKLEGQIAFYSRIVVSEEIRLRIMRLGAYLNDGGVGDAGLWYLGQILVREPDGCFALDYMSDFALDWIRQQEDLSLYVMFLRRARKYIENRIDSMRASSSVKDDLKTSSINLKYQFLHLTYDKFWKRIEDASKGLSILPEDFDAKYPIRKIDNYYCLYLTIDTLPALKQTELRNQCGSLMSSMTMTYMTVHYIRQLYKALHEAKNSWVNRPKNIFEHYYAGKLQGTTEEDVKTMCNNLHIGFQQLSSHIMVSVRDDNNMALPFFVFLLVSLMPAILPTFAGGCLISCSAVYRRGWELFDNCIQGPVVWDAYRLADESSSYPRVAISVDLRDKILASAVCRNIWKGVEELIFQDLDGVHCFDYLCKTTIKNFEVFSKPDSPRFNEFYQWAVDSIFKVRLALSYAGVPTSSSVQLCRKLLLLEMYMVRKGMELGMQDCIKEARAHSFSEVNKLYHLNIKE